MFVLRFFASLTLLLCPLSVVFADVPPDPGFRRVTRSIVIESGDDFPDHRFFIRSGNDVREIVLKNGTVKTIEPLGGGAYYRMGTVFAIPVKSLTDLAAAQGAEISEELKTAIKDQKVNGMVKLFDHNFVTEVPEKDAKTVKEIVYRLTRLPDGGINAEPIEPLNGPGQSSAPKYFGYTNRFYEGRAIFLYIAGAGAVLGVFFIVSGVLLLRRNR